MGKLFIPGNKVVAAFAAINRHSMLGDSPLRDIGILENWNNGICGTEILSGRQNSNQNSSQI